MKTKFLVLAMAILFASCARIPIQSIDLVTIIHDEGERMHQLNTALTNNLFTEKRTKIDDFIRLEYTPNFIGEFTARIPENIDVKQELPGILASMIPVINEQIKTMPLTKRLFFSSIGTTSKFSVPSQITHLPL